MLLEKDKAFTAVACSLNFSKTYNDSYIASIKGNKKILSTELNVAVDKIIIATNCSVEPNFQEAGIEIIDRDKLYEINKEICISFENIEEENKQRYSIELIKKIISC
jgi:hypothetical protein